jgi:hypothetical protein
MTKRSVILGLIGVVIVAAVTFFNDHVMHQTHLIGNNMPIVVFGMLLLYVLAAPLLGRHALRGPEIAVALAIVLAACCIPGSSMMRAFGTSLIQPQHYNRIYASWRSQEVMEMVPDRMLADVSEDENRVLDGFRQGLRTGPEAISFRDVPWRAWTRAVAFWLPIFLATWLAVIGLSLVLHRQWSRHEHLPYPIVAFTNSLFPDESGRWSPVLRSRLFWTGLTLVFLVHMSRFAAGTFPEYVIEIKRQFNLQAFRELIPALDTHLGRQLLSPVLYFTVVAIAFMIPKDVSFSLGIGPFLYAVAVGALLTYGIQVETSNIGTGNYLSPQPRQFLLLGGNLGLFGALVYSGRHHYRQVFGHALRPGGHPDVLPYETWGARLFLVMILVLALQLRLAGVSWPMAVLYVLLLMLLYTVMGRLISEAGLFYMQPFVWPCAALWGLFGVGAIGLPTLVAIQMVSTVLFIDPRESLMPFLVNNWKLLDLHRVAPGRVAVWCAVALVVCVTVALPVTLYLHYDQGSSVADSWTQQHVPTFALNNAAAVKQQLEARGELEQAMQPPSGSNVSRIRMEPSCGWALFIGLIGAAGLAAARLRLPWWPLHPILMVTCATVPLQRTAPSFLLGWLVKLAVDRYGGSALVNRLKPLMFGFIAGEVLGAILPSMIGAVHFFVTGETLTNFWVLPP